MKTTKIVIAAILVLVTATTFAQAEKSLVKTVKYSYEMNRFETWLPDIHERLNRKVRIATDLPVITQSYYMDDSEISYTIESDIEQGMSDPYEEDFVEEDMPLEPWMSDPFETEEVQEGLVLEPWMSTPFVTDELIPVEEWMSASNW